MKSTSAPVIVVGAGFGGLAAAVELGRRGERVILLEREVAAGGKARTVRVADRDVEVGPTVLTMRWVFDALLEATGTTLDQLVSLEAADVIARHGWTDGSRLDLFADLSRSAAAIERFAGRREADAYLRFADYSRDIAETVRGPFLESPRPSPASLLGQAGQLGLRGLGKIDAHRTMRKALGSYFRDPRLLQLFSRYATYVGSSAFAAAGTFNLIAHVEREGVYRVRGGMPALAAGLVEVAQRLGVEVRFGASVTRLTLGSSGAVSGVVLGDGAHLPARAVVANLDVASVAAGQLGREAAAAVKVGPRERRALSAITFAFVGRVGAASAFPLSHHNVFFEGDTRDEMDAIFVRRVVPAAPAVYVCAEDRAAHDDEDASGGGGNQAGRGDERFFAIVNAPADGDRGQPNPDEVERCRRYVLSRLSRAGLELELRAMTVMTPATYEQAAPGTGGSLYGEAAHGAFAPLTRPAATTRIDGLYLAGGSVHPGPGVPMATLSGRLAAREILATDARRGSTWRSGATATTGSTSTE